MADLNKTGIFRMMHIDNIPHVLQNGITHASSPNANAAYVPIGDGSLISSRSQFKIPNGKRLGAYIPFYFGVRMPMLYVIQKGFNMVPSVPPEKIVYCVSTVQKMVDHQLPFVFTNGHAVDSFTDFFEEKDVKNIDKLIDKDAIDAKYWKQDNDNDLKRRKEAEFLVESDIPPEAIVCWIVYNRATKTDLIHKGVPANLIRVKPDCYF
ncbi:MAG: type II toxin-antitoxin system toxin DNA ADP-ribosyl transferase DarT [Saprospiraceae bacterium]